MNRILVASDLSSRSDRAVERAVQLAGEHGGKIILMHVIDEDLPAAVVSRMRQTAEEVLGVVAASEHAPDNTEIVVETGDPVRTIAEMAEAIDADLVVLGVHKPRPFWDMFSGTTMERVVRALHRPVLLVRDPVSGPYASVLCGIDLSPSCLAAGRTALTLAPKAKIATFHAVHVPYRGMIARDASEKQLAPFVKDARARLDTWWDSAAIPVGLPKPEVTPASVHDAFAEAMTRSGADLFALGAHGRMPLSPSLLGGFTEEQIRDPRCDLLVVRG
ncbi:universal stress protein [Celeribacter persicus]|uniref:Nucleotide-binding universal stress UspA family protein n=1 Tax=Celeribacter persicus TaxID=1651082 RepID=A0A2T5H8X7_9RHOB|nr:universal stress protein [Celeribacter persicus]PTQ68026.1 nucleotide-binding universal stress UspA family protein [Celeribacter persicus]